MEAEERETRDAGAHHRRGGFRNPWPSGRLHGVGGLLRWMVVERFTHPRRADPPPSWLPRAAPDVAMPRAGAGELRATWVGHSTFLLQVGGLNVLTDPVWSERASPVWFAGPRRWAAPGVSLDALPPLDVVLISHNHYDHLDDRTVRTLARAHPAAVWLAPLGLGAWLRLRGVATAVESDWWDELRPERLGGAAFTCTPAQHFSGRGLGDRDRTLWCGWVVRAGGRSVYYVGDTGRHPEFGRVGEQCGPFDLVLMPVGAYDPRWFMRPVHLDPEEAVASFVELTRADGGGPPSVMAAMHWGTFKLTDEPMDEPPRRTRQAWAARGMAAERLWVPRCGETLVL